MILDYHLTKKLTKDFQLSEFNCNDYRNTRPPHSLILNICYLAVQLQKIRDYLKLKMIQINSGYRTETYNKLIGGAKNSNHTKGHAADIVQYDMSNQKFYYAIKELVKIKVIPDGEIILYDTFVHYAPNIEFNHLPRPANYMYDNSILLDYAKDINSNTQEKLEEIRKKYKI